MLLGRQALLHVCSITFASCLSSKYWPDIGHRNVVVNGHKHMSVDAHGSVIEAREVMLRRESTTPTIYTHGPAVGRPALDYFQRWAKGAIATAHRHGKVDMGTVLTQMDGAHWSMHCSGTPVSKHETWELFETMDGGEQQVQHFVFRTMDHRLQYIAMRSDKRVLVADPPICSPEAKKAMIEIDHLTSVKVADEPESGEPEMLHTNDTIVNDCIALIHRTAMELCGKDLTIEVVKADLRIVDGFAVDLEIIVKNWLSETHHNPECAFELDHHNQTSEANASQLPEERNGMTTTLVMRTDLCQIDAENGVSNETVADNLLARQYSRGELSFLKGYEHINDGLPVTLEDFHEVDDEEDWRSKYPTCFPGAGNSGVVRNQANCGSCWAFAAGTSMMNTLCISTAGSGALDDGGSRFEISVQQMMTCNSYQRGCNGGASSLADQVFRARGVTKERDSTYQCGSGSALDHFGEGGSCAEYPWGEGATCDASKNIAAWTYSGAAVINGEDLMKQAVAAGYGTYVGFLVYANFMSYLGGIYSTTSGANYGGHAVSLIGYGLSGSTKYWILQNSWGSGWGERGFFRFLRGANLCEIEARNPTYFMGSIAASAATTIATTTTVADTTTTTVTSIVGDTTTLADTTTVADTTTTTVTSIVGDTTTVADTTITTTVASATDITDTTTTTTTGNDAATTIDITTTAATVDTTANSATTTGDVASTISATTTSTTTTTVTTGAPGPSPSPSRRRKSATEVVAEDEVSFEIMGVNYASMTTQMKQNVQDEITLVISEELSDVSAADVSVTLSSGVSKTDSLVSLATPSLNVDAVITLPAGSAKSAASEITSSSTFGAKTIEHLNTVAGFDDTSTGTLTASSIAGLTVKEVRVTTSAAPHEASSTRPPTTTDGDWTISGSVSATVQPLA